MTYKHKCIQWPASGGESEVAGVIIDAEDVDRIGEVRVFPSCVDLKLLMEES